MTTDTTKMSLVYAPADVLQSRCSEVQSSDNVKDIAEKMLEIMRNHGGIGLAANQAGVPLRMFVMQLGKMKKPKICINPVIIHSCHPYTENEGCLSEPGLTQKVTRDKFILIKYTDINGKMIQEHMKELEARCAQHEIDHLEGILLSNYSKKDSQHLSKNGK